MMRPSPDRLVFRVGRIGIWSGSYGGVICRENIDEQIKQVMVEIDRVQKHMTPVLHDCLCAFLEENADPEAWEYSLPEGQINTGLIYAQYFSRKDIDTCLAFNIGTFNDHADAESIRELFEAFQEAYCAEAED
jgi:hypothetical protein